MTRIRLLSRCLHLLIVMLLMPVSAVRAEDVVRVGFIAPMSGMFATYGEKFLNSAKAYQAVHGDTVAGKRVELVVRDNTANTPDMAKRLAQELLTRDKVDFLTGFALSPDALAVAPLADKARKPMVIMLAATSGLTAKYSYVTRASYTNSQVSGPMGQWAYKNGIRKVSILVADYAPGIQSGEAFSAAFKSAGGEIVEEVRVPLQNLDYSPYVQRIKDAKAEAVFTFLPSGEPMNAFMKTFDQRGLVAAGVKVLTTTDISPEYLVPMGDAALALVNTMPYFEVLDNPANRTYQQAYQKIAGQPAGPIAVGGYDAMAVIYQALAKAGGDASDGAKLMDAIKGMTIDSPRGRFVIDPATRDIIQSVYIARVEKRGGKLAPVIIDQYPDVH